MRFGSSSNTLSVPERSTFLSKWNSLCRVFSATYEKKVFHSKNIYTLLVLSVPESRKACVCNSLSCSAFAVSCQRSCHFCSYHERMYHICNYESRKTYDRLPSLSVLFSPREKRKLAQCEASVASGERSPHVAPFPQGTRIPPLRYGTPTACDVSPMPSTRGSGLKDFATG